MNKQQISKFFQDAKKTIVRKSPEILTGVGIAGMITTTVLAVKATPKAINILRECADERGYGYSDNEIPTKFILQSCWKCYVPAFITCVLSTVCLIGASSVNARRNTALAAAYSLSETALREYKEKVVETIGEKKEQTIRDKIAKEKIDENPVSKTEVIVTEKGNTLCLDTLSKRYFRSDIERIRRAENNLNKEILTGSGYVAVNDLYDELGLDHTIMGDDLGWSLDTGTVEIELSSQIAEDGTPCIVVGYAVAPKYNYYKFH